MEIIIRIKDTPSEADPSGISFSVEYKKHDSDGLKPTPAMYLGDSLHNTLTHIADEVPPCSN